MGVVLSSLKAGTSDRDTPHGASTSLSVMGHASCPRKSSGRGEQKHFIRKRLSPVSPLVAVAGGTMTGLAANQSLLLSRGSHPVWLDADLGSIVTHPPSIAGIVLVKRHRVAVNAASEGGL